MLKIRRLGFLFSGLGALLLLVTAANAQGTLVGDVFRSGFEGWTDVNGDIGTPKSTWGVLLTGDKFLFEESDDIPLGSSGAAAGTYTSYMMIDTADQTPADYTLTANMATVDNDGLGVVFGYVDADNFFRVGMRQQSGGSFGFPTGTSVQKVVGGVVTQLFTDGTVVHPFDGTAFDVEVDVVGTAFTVTVNGTAYSQITDADLQTGSFGVHSWAQKQLSSGVPQYGTMVHSTSISSATLNKTTDFDDAVVAKWRPLLMLNSNGVGGAHGDDLGNFRQDFSNNTIFDNSNGFEYATTDDNADFVGPGVVIDEPGAASWSDYRMKVRMQNTDDDGIGLLFRVEDDDSFYRLNFTNQSIGANTSNFRAPQGMSIQKNDNGVWTEIFRDDQNSPEFVFDLGVPFDVSLRVLGDTIDVDIVNDPDGAATLHSYGPIVDGSSPILAGSVGFTNWGSGDNDFRVTYSGYGGENGPLLISIPEPSSAVLVILVGLASLRSRARV